MGTSNERMANAPIYYALVQVKFTPIAAMKKYVADIQDALRVEGFPLFETHETTELRFEFKNSNEPPNPSFEPVTQWLMINPEKTAGFVLGNDFINFHTTNYITHEPFISSLMQGLNKVIEYAKPSFINRLGLRYLDAVMPHANETVEQYLVNELHGVDFGLQPIQSIQEAVFSTSVEPLIQSGVMVTRIHKMNSQLGFPPDMLPNGLIPLPQFTNTEQRWHAIIDMDHYVEGYMPIEPHMIEKQLLSLHGKVKESFHKMVSDFAIDKWQ
ncbi:TIGR04255 family protein [Yersinia proxima]|uniref:TIGR04255 family protein n=1 Tax=Yersinia proxima TaxID=2890316 RepID=UPI003D68AF61